MTSLLLADIRNWRDRNLATRRIGPRDKDPAAIPVTSYRGSRLKPSEFLKVFKFSDLGDSRRTRGLSILPEVVEAIGGKLGVEDRVLDVPVTEIELDGAGVLAVVGEFEAG